MKIRQIRQISFPHLNFYLYRIEETIRRKYYLEMAKNIIAKCPNCGHNFIVKKYNSGVMGAVVGGVICSTVGLTVTIGTFGIGAPIVGACVGYALSHKSKSCECPECKTEFDKPEN